MAPRYSIRAIVGSEAEDFMISSTTFDKASVSFRRRIQIQEHSDDIIIDLLDTSIDVFEAFMINAHPSPKSTLTRTAACHKLTRCPVCGKNTVDWDEKFLIELCIFAFDTGIEHFIDLVCFELTAYYGPLRLPSQAALEASMHQKGNDAVYLLLLSYWIHEMDDSGVDEAARHLSGEVIDDACVWRDGLGEMPLVDEEVQAVAVMLRMMYDAVAGRWLRWREETCVHLK